VPATESMGPAFSSWTGPTKLRSTVEGDGPKYERSTVAPTEGWAGNTLHPGVRISSGRTVLGREKSPIKTKDFRQNERPAVSG
jgi:hypothetical protein